MENKLLIAKSYLPILKFPTTLLYKYKTSLLILLLFKISEGF